MQYVVKRTLLNYLQHVHYTGSFHILPATSALDYSSVSHFVSVIESLHHHICYYGMLRERSVSSRFLGTIGGIILRMGCVPTRRAEPLLSKQTTDDCSERLTSHLASRLRVSETKLP